MMLLLSVVTVFVGFATAGFIRNDRRIQRFEVLCRTGLSALEAWHLSENKEATKDFLRMVG